MIDIKLYLARFTKLYEKNVAYKKRIAALIQHICGVDVPLEAIDVDRRGILRIAVSGSKKMAIHMKREALAKEASAYLEKSIDVV